MKYNIDLLAYLILGAFFVKRSIHMFQQNRYELYRYTKWLFDFDHLHLKGSTVYGAIYIILMIIIALWSPVEYLMIVMTLNLTLSIYLLWHDHKHAYIKPLVYTARVKRTVVAMLVLMVLGLWGMRLLAWPFLVLGIFAIIGPYLLIYPMTIIMYPIERGIKQNYENKAKKYLRSLDDLKIIGITGSYGKTSTKNVVKGLLEERYYTLATPLSYNTPMGLTRVILNDLKPTHEVFISEMGADKVGEITHLMDFIQPRYAIVTSIGPQHLNTFKSMENIIHEKMQAIEKLPSDGVGIINTDNEYIRNYEIKNTCKIIKVALHDEKADYHPLNMQNDHTGGSFTLRKDGEIYQYHTQLLGEHNLLNILMGIAMAHELGVPLKDTIKAVERLKPSEHRLEQKIINGYHFIDNAYNSNPVTCKLSLDVLKTMPGKRVIITPGLIDLGKQQDAYNRSFGEYMQGRTDYVFLVGAVQTKAIYEGLKDSGFMMDKVQVFDDVYAAFDYLYNHISTDSTILLENDLPDAFVR